MARNYHSTALLLPNGTVFNGGGGLCGGCVCGPGTATTDGCMTPNHQDFQIFTPPYLFAPDGAGWSMRQASIPDMLCVCTLCG